MNIQVVSAIISASSELLGEVIRNRKPTSINTTPDLSGLSGFEEPEPVMRKRKPYFIIDPEHDVYDEEVVDAVEAPRSHVTVNIEPRAAKKTVPQLREPKQIDAETLQLSEGTELTENKATAIPTGCIPCSLGHVGTCSGLLNEATRFARGPNGAQDPEVIDRVNMCLDELNSLEREDLRPEKVTQLKGWERELADKVLKASRDTRHKLEDVSNMNTRGLEEIAGQTQTVRQAIGREWFQNKIANFSQKDQDTIKNRVMAKLEQMRAEAAKGESAEATEEEVSA